MKASKYILEYIFYKKQKKILFFSTSSNFQNKSCRYIKLYVQSHRGVDFEIPEMHACTYRSQKKIYQYR